jgi:pimeloyl-ACP methyl ester carboxylesterase
MTVSVWGLDLHVMAGGTGGETIVYLHGEDRAGAWQPFHDLLADAGFAVYAPDLPGFGRSQRMDCREDVSDYAFLLLDWLDAAGLRPVHLVGLSLGGWVAAEAAALDCSYMRTLTLVDPLGLELPGIELPDVFLLSPADWLTLLYADPAAAGRRLAEPLDEESLTASVRGRVTFARLAWNPYVVDTKLARRLHRARVPAFILWGESDRFIPARAAERWRDVLPGAEIHILPGCGHLPPAECPEAFTRAVLSFIGRHRRD